MSFETIRIERRQPVYDKKFVKPPSAEDGELPYVTVTEIENSIDSPTDGDDGKVSIMSIGRGRKYSEFTPYYSKISNMDFITYDEVGLDGKRVSTNSLFDFQQQIRDIAESKPGANRIV